MSPDCCHQGGYLRANVSISEGDLARAARRAARTENPRHIADVLAVKAELAVKRQNVLDHECTTPTERTPR